MQAQDIGLLVLAVGVSQIGSSPFWGRMADSTSKQVMARSAQIATGAVLLALCLSLLPIYSLQYAGYLLVFVLIGLAESGVRLGRKTYLVDAVPAGERPTFTAFSNSVIGVLAVCTGVAGLVAQWLGATVLLLVIGLITLAGAWACQRMPEAEAMLDEI